MNRSPSKVSFLFFLLWPLFSHAYVGMPLTQLKEKGVTLSVMPGLHQQPVTLHAQAPPGMSLLLSLDGNIPTSSQRFDRAIVLSATTPVTIALIENGQRSDTLYFGTYLIDFSSTLPITTLIIPPADLFDPTHGIYVGGLTPDGERWGNCWGESERQSFFELIKDGEIVLAQGVGLRIFGGMTRQNSEKSLRVIARKKYGKGKFKYRVFPTKDIQTFNSLVLRTSGNDWRGTRFKDMMIASLAKDMNIDHMAYQPSVLFVNGEYWGIHNLREKISLSYLEENHGADPEQTNLLQGLGTSASHGTAATYKELFGFLSTHPPTEPGFIDSVEKRMDIDNYFKYLCLQIHIQNLDSRGNVRYWQAKNLDNRFRWIFYDGDLGFGGAGRNYLKDRLSPIETVWYNPPATTFLLRHLVANPSLRDRFITQYCFLLSTWLHADTVARRIQFFRSWLEPEIERHLNRKNYQQSKSNWLGQIKVLTRFAEQRMPLAFEHLQSTFQLGETYQLSVESPLPPEKIRYALERNPIPTLPYRGFFFKDARVQVEVDFLHPRYRFTGWNDGSTNPRHIVLNPIETAVTVSARVIETPASSRKGKIWINSLGIGKKDQPRFIEINGSKKEADSIWLVDSRKSFSLTIPRAQLPLVITTDTLAFKKEFPKAKTHLMQCDKIRLKTFGKTLYLLELSGDWIDSVDMLAWDTLHRQHPYWVRQSNGKLAGMKNAPDFTLATQPWYTISSPWMLTGAIAIILLGVAFVLLRKKQRSAPIGILLWCCLFSSSTSQAQKETETAVKYRNVDTEILRKSSLVYKGINQVQEQASFYRTYQSIQQPLIWVAPFSSTDLAKGNWHELFSVERFKELATDPVSVRHMKFVDRKAYAWIAGVKKEFFLIDTAKKLYLARIEHRNGLESWYYPLVNPNREADERVPGTPLGATGGFYFWQLRFRSCTLLASAIVQSDGQPDPKGFVLENLCPPFTNPSARVQNFLKAVFQKITEQGLGGDWEKALEEELKKQ